MANLKDTIVLGNLTVTGKVVASDILISGTGNEFDSIKVNDIYAKNQSNVYLKYSRDSGDGAEHYGWKTAGSNTYGFIFPSTNKTGGIGTDSNIYQQGYFQHLYTESIIPAPGKTTIEIANIQNEVDLTIQTTGDLNLKASGDVTMGKFSGVELEASTTTLSISANSIDLYGKDSSTQITSEGNYMITLNGSQVLVDTTVRPSSNATYNCGANNNMWNNIYAKKYMAATRDYNGSTPEAANMTAGSPGQVLTSGGSSGNSFWQTLSYSKIYTRSFTRNTGSTSTSYSSWWYNTIYYDDEYSAPIGYDAKFVIAIVFSGHHGAHTTPASYSKSNQSVFFLTPPSNGSTHYYSQETSDGTPTGASTSSSIDGQINICTSYEYFDGDTDWYSEWDFGVAGKDATSTPIFVTLIYFCD